MLHKDNQDNFLLYLAATDKLVIEAAVITALEEALPDQELLEDNSTYLIWGTPKVDVRILPNIESQGDQNLTIEINIDLLSSFDCDDPSLLHKSCLAGIMKEVSIEFAELYKNIFNKVTVIYSIESDSNFKPYLSEMIEASLSKTPDNFPWDYTVYEE